MEVLMHTQRLDLAGWAPTGAAIVKPADTEPGKPAIRRHGYQVQLGAVGWLLKGTKTPRRGHILALKCGAV